MSRTMPCHVEGRARQCKTLQGCGRSGKSFLVSPLRHAGPGDLLCGKKAKSYGLRTKRKVARPVNTSVYQDLTLSWLRMPKRIMASSAALRNLQQPQFRSDTFRILAAAGQFPTLASSSGRDYKA